MNSLSIVAAGIARDNAPIEIVREAYGIVLAEAAGRWFVVERKGDQFLSTGPDDPKGGGRWFGRATAAGLRYVAQPPEFRDLLLAMAETASEQR